MKGLMMRITLAALLLGMISPAFAAGKVKPKSEKIKFGVDAPKSVAVGDEFLVEFTVNTNSNRNLFTPPQFKGCELRAEPMVGTSYSLTVTNGISFPHTTYIYRLVCAEAGRLVIGPAELSVNGRKYRSKRTSIKVTDQPVQEAVPAAEANFEIKAPEQVAEGETFRVEFIVNATPDHGSFSAPSFKGCEQLAGPMFSSFSRLKDGSIVLSVKTTYTYIIVCRKAGSVKIGPATLSVSGKKYTTKPFTIRVAIAE